MTLTYCMTHRVSGDADQHERTIDELRIARVSCMAPVATSSFYAELGRRVKERRTALRLTQDALASELGMQRTSIANLEKGSQRISAEAVAILAAALRVSPAALLPEQTTRDSRLDELIRRQVPSGLRPYLLSAAKTLK